MSYIIQDREAGNKITTFETLEEAKAELEKYENIDKNEGNYTDNFYEIIEGDVFEIDASMLGSEFSGEENSLRNFCKILQKLLPNAWVVPVCCSYNGAKNENENEIDDIIWNKAIDEHAKQYPNDWN